MVDAEGVGGEGFGGFAPGGVVFVVDDVVRAKLFEGVGFSGGAGGGEDAGAGSFGELVGVLDSFLGSFSLGGSYLQSEYADSAGSLCEHRLPRLQCLGFQPIKPVPCRQRCTR